MNLKQIERRDERRMLNLVDRLMRKYGLQGDVEVYRDAVHVLEAGGFAPELEAFLRNEVANPRPRKRPSGGGWVGDRD